MIHSGSITVNKRRFCPLDVNVIYLTPAKLKQENFYFDTYSPSLQLLRKHGSVLGYDVRQLSVIDSEMSKEIVFGLCSENASHSDKMLVYKAIEVATRRGEQSCKDDRVTNVYKRYEEYLRLHNYVDFNGILVKCLEVLGKKPDILRHVQFVMVDEAQDCNDVQHQITEAVLRSASASAQLMIVGDQSIYSFLDVDPARFQSTKIRFNPISISMLTINYRTPKWIMRAAEHVITQDPNRTPKESICRNGEGLPMVLMKCHSVNEQMTRIVAQIRTLVDASLFTYTDCVVLLRVNRWLDDVAVALQEAKIPFRIVGDGSLFTQPGIVLMINVLRFCQRPNIVCRYRRMLNLLQTNTTFTELLTDTTSTQFGLVDHQFPVDNPQSDGIVAVLNGCRDIITTITNDRPTNIPLLVRLTSELNFPDIVQRPIASDLNRLIRFAESCDSLDDFFDHASLHTEVDDWNDHQQDQQHFVTISTMHAAKALQWPVVFIPRCTEVEMPYRHIPHAPMAKATIDEECRILYVAMSRSSLLLYCFYQNGKLSRFLKSLPPTHFVLECHSIGAIAAAFAEQNPNNDYDCGPVAVVNVHKDVECHFKHVLPPNTSVTIGRNPNNSIPVRLNSIARFAHVTLSHKNGLITVQSSKDTWLNDRPLTPGSIHVLQPNTSTIRLGHQRVNTTAAAKRGATVTVVITPPIECPQPTPSPPPSQINYTQSPPSPIECTQYTPSPACAVPNQLRPIAHSTPHSNQPSISSAQSVKLRTAALLRIASINNRQDYYASPAMSSAQAEQLRLDASMNDRTVNDSEYDSQRSVLGFPTQLTQSIECTQPTPSPPPSPTQLTQSTQSIECTQPTPSPPPSPTQLTQSTQSVNRKRPASANTHADSAAKLSRNSPADSLQFNALVATELTKAEYDQIIGGEWAGTSDSKIISNVPADAAFSLHDRVIRNIKLPNSITTSRYTSDIHSALTPCIRGCVTRKFYHLRSFNAHLLQARVHINDSLFLAWVSTEKKVYYGWYWYTMCHYGRHYYDIRRMHNCLHRPDDAPSPPHIKSIVPPTFDAFVPAVDFVVKHLKCPSYFEEFSLFLRNGDYGAVSQELIAPPKYKALSSLDDLPKLYCLISTNPAINVGYSGKTIRALYARVVHNRRKYPTEIAQIVNDNSFVVTVIGTLPMHFDNDRILEVEATHNAFFHRHIVFKIFQNESKLF